MTQATITTITVDLTESVESQFEQFHRQLDAVRAAHHRNDLIKAIRVLCAEAVGCTSTGRDMFPAVVSAATAGTMAGVKSISGHTANHSYVAEEHREELRTLTAELYAIS
jgi:predicted TIM-barrel enzyme